jgi:hypothetical protein
MDDHDGEPTGRYLGRSGPTGGRVLWWAPPGGAPWEYLPTTGRRSPDGPNWGYDGNGPLDAAEAILLHATADFTVAFSHARAFRADVLDRHPMQHDLDLPAAEVEQWLSARGIALAPGWGPLGPQPVIEWVRTRDAVERYTIALDGWDLLGLDLPETTPIAHIGLTDLKGRVELSWARTVSVAEPDGGHTRAQIGERVRTDPLPFGGWAVQVDGVDVAIVERDPTSLTDARVAVYDRSLDSGFLVFDGTIRYRQLPTEPAAIGERLRRFTDTAGRGRTLGR